MRLQEGHRRTVGTRITHELRRKPVDLLPHKLMSQGHTTRGIAYRSPARAQIRKPKHRGWILRRLTIRLHLQLLHGKMRHRGSETRKEDRKHTWGPALCMGASGHTEVGPMSCTRDKCHPISPPQPKLSPWSFETMDTDTAARLDRPTAAESFSLAAPQLGGSCIVALRSGMETDLVVVASGSTAKHAGDKTVGQL